MIGLNEMLVNIKSANAILDDMIQPSDIQHPAGVLGRQFSTVSDEISSTGLYAKIFGNSTLKKIPGTIWGMLRLDEKKVVGLSVVGGYDGYGGHLIGTWQEDLKNLS